MSKIDELLKGEKVEWRRLGDIANISGAGVDKKINYDEKPIILLNYMDVYKNLYLDKSIPKMEVTASAIKMKECNIRYGDIFITPSSETKEDIFMSSVATEDLENTVYSYHIMRIRLKKENFITSCFLNYIFRSQIFRKIMLKKVYGNTRQTIAKSEIEKLEVPIPSIEKQEKIVKTLDKFTEYVTELQAELQARVKQYEYYRDELLSEDYLNKLINGVCNFDSKVYELKSFELNELVKIRNGKDWKDLEKGNIPVYGSGGNMNVYVNKYSYDKPTVLIPRKGSIENVFYLEEPFWNVDTIFYTEIDENKIIPKYFYYFIENFDMSKLCTSSTRPSLTQSVLNKLKIDLPPLEIQSKVVEILDKFQSLISETKGLLPQEIEQRQKQYEFYREKLLTFDDKVVAHTHTQLISSSYFEILKEACDILKINIASNYFYKLSDCTLNIEKINWNNLSELNYIDLSSINRENNSVIETTKINKNNAPSRAKQIIKESDILFGTTRPTLKRFYKVEKCYDGQACSTGFCVLRADTKKVIPKWIYYSIRTSNFFEYIKINEVGTSYPSISDAKVKDYEIIVPPLYVQEYVVSILDKFDSLINDINEGLPKEIELRQKQYEYYREKLLDFPR